MAKTTKASAATAFLIFLAVGGSDAFSSSFSGSLVNRIHLNVPSSIGVRHGHIQPTSIRMMATSSDITSPLAKLNIPNPFASSSSSSSSEETAKLKPRPPSTLPPPPAEGLSGNAEALFARAKAVLASDLGIRDGGLLDENFIWIGPSLGSKVLGKQDYLAAGKFFDLRSAFPDLDYRAHDFRIDEKDPLTVRLTARTVGTMRGELRLRKETLPPNGKRMRCPPEAISMSFDNKTGKLKKLCSGFTMDRLVGNTAGLCGVMAAAAVAGAPPSEWEIYPPLYVIRRFFGRTVKQLPEASSFLAPFPETVMIQLAKGVIAADNGASDPDLLAPSFTFCGPLVGPLGKKEFVKQFGEFAIKNAFSDLDTGICNFRVDPYDPYRVWADVRPSGTWTGPLAGKPPNGAKFEGPPEAVSFTFDDDGFCTRLTAGAVMDPSLGNTGGLGGVFGILYGVGAPLPGVTSRPLPQLLGRLQKRITKPFTGIGPDDYVLPKRPSVTLPKPAAVKKPIAPPPAPKLFTPAKKSSPVPSQKPKPPMPPKAVMSPKLPSLSVKKAPPKQPPVAPKKKPVPPSVATGKKESPLAKLSVPKIKPPSPPPAKKAGASPISSDPTDAVTEAFASFFGTKSTGRLKKETPPEAKSTSVAKAQKVKADAAAKAKADAAAKAKAQEAAAAKKAKAEEAAAAKKAEAEAEAAAKKKKAEEAAAAKKAKEEAAAAKKAELEAARRRKAEEAKAKQAQKKVNTAKAERKPTVGPPPGVPILTKWRKNRDGSVTGLISGSDAFDENARVTTSPIEAGEFEAGSVVQTESGSRYFLSD